MNITFKHLSLKNFCGLKGLDTDLYPRTIIKGVNATGKTTITNAIYWVLTDKTVDGAQADVKPRDNDGEEIHNLETEVILTMDADGKEIRAKKVSKENWVKDRTTQQNVYKGNENSFEINEIPKKKADFEEYLSQFVNLNDLAFCMNPRIFLNMATKDRRATLFRLVDDSDAAVIATDERFKELESDLMDGSIEELINRAKKAKSGYTDQLKEIPARIDEVQGSIKELSEEEKKAYETELAEKEKALKDITDLDANISKMHKQISEMKIEQSRIATNASIESQKAYADFGNKKTALQKKISSDTIALRDSKDRSDRAKAKIAEIEAQIPLVESKIKAKKAEKIDKGSLSCPTCKRPYDEAQAEQITKEFDTAKKERIKDLKATLTDLKAQLDDWNVNFANANEECWSLEKEISELNKEFDAMGDITAGTVDFTNNAEYQEITKKILKTQEDVSKFESADNASHKAYTINRIAELKSLLNRESVNKAYEERIAELNKEQLMLSQKIADQEKMLDLLTDYQRAKIGIVTDAINQYFKVIKWRFFRQQINGGWQEVCEPLIDGISMDRTLNHGHKLLANLDLCEAFQRKAGLHIPLMIDDTESLDEWRIPKTDSQLICIRRTDDPTLVIESLT